MTRYTVVWPKGTQDELAELWIIASDRDAVTLATNVIDLELSQDASTKGAAMIEGLRAYFAPPLRILFTVDEGNRSVEVVRVRRF